MNWLVYALIAALGITTYSLLMRKFLTPKCNSQAFALMINIIAGIGLLVLSLFEDRKATFTLFSIALLLGGGILYAVINILYTKGRKREEVSKVSIIKQAESVWGFVAGLLIMGEDFSWMKLLGVGLILLGGSIVIWKKGEKFEFSHGMIYMFAGTFFASASALVDKMQLTQNFSPSLYGGIMFLLSSSFLFVSLKDRMKCVVEEARLQKFRVILTGIFVTFSMFFVFKTLQSGDVSKAIPVLNTSLILSVLGGIVFFKERDNMAQKIIGAAIAFGGVLFLR
jgi:drug/metabolite transporter (DMT)-like permease